MINTEQAGKSGNSEGQSLQEISRSVVLHEIFVGDRAYLLLVHKISRDWWELPGGMIDGLPTTDSHFRDEAEREWKEEVHIPEKPSTATPLFSIIPDDPTGQDSDVILNTADRKIISHPFMIREIRDRVPEVVSGHTNEHDKFMWLDITDIYSIKNQGRARRDLTKVFKDLSSHGEKGALTPLPLQVNRENPSIIKIGEPNPLWPNQRQLVFSSVTARVMDHYLSPRHVFTPPVFIH